MNANLCQARGVFRVLTVVLTTAITVAGVQAANTEVAAVFSATFNGYTRTRLPDGSFKPETYTFAPGKRLDGLLANDSIDHVPLMKVLQTIAGPLQSQGYVGAAHAKDTDLIIFVFWGITTGAENGRYTNTLATLQSAMQSSAWATPASPRPSAAESAAARGAANDLDLALDLNALENRLRDRNNVVNAQILGYAEDLQRAWDIPWFTGSRDVVHELEADRYFVVLRAYDFQLLWKQKTPRLLWETRYSITEHGNRFDEQLAAMTRTAAPYFGQDHHLVRRRLPNTSVEVGTPVVVPDEKK
jgi:hypothetical protein